MAITNVRKVLKTAAKEAGFEGVSIVFIFQDLWYTNRDKTPYCRRYKLAVIGMSRAKARSVVAVVSAALPQEGYSVKVYDQPEKGEDVRWAVVVRQELKAANKAE